MFTGPSDFRFPNVADNGQPDAQPQPQPQSESQSESQSTTGYSKLFKMGLFSVSIRSFSFYTITLSPSPFFLLARRVAFSGDRMP